MARSRTRRATSRVEAEEREAAHLMLQNPEELIREQNSIAREMACLNQRYIEVQ